MLYTSAGARHIVQADVIEHLLPCEVVIEALGPHNQQLPSVERRRRLQSVFGCTASA